MIKTRSVINVECSKIFIKTVKHKKDLSPADFYHRSVASHVSCQSEILKMKSEENRISFCFIDGSGAGRSISEIKFRDFMSSRRELL